MRPATLYRVIGGVLLLAACGAAFGWFFLGVGAALCEGERVHCMEIQDDGDPWGIASLILLVAAGGAFVQGRRLARRETSGPHAA